jgi:F-type H+-transporting ATPase subunit delta
MADIDPKTSETDIDRQKLGAIYARALLGACEKAGISDRIVAELNSLVDDVFGRVAGIESLLATPRISVEEKYGMLDRVFGPRMSSELLTFLKVVCQHGRLDCLRQIRQAARLELNRMRGRVEVQVTTAEPIDDNLAERIVAVLQGKLGVTVDLVRRVDPSLLGGLVVRVGDTLYDGSIRNRLVRLRSETIERTFQQLRESADRFVMPS